jgi:hypothetical protein
MRLYNTVIGVSAAAAAAVVILLLTLAIVVAVTVQTGPAIFLAVSATSFVTGFMGAVGLLMWMNRCRISSPKFLARAEAKAREKDAMIAATIIDETGNRGGADNGVSG